MNNTEIIDLFRSHLSDEAVLLPLRPGPPVLGGKFQKHLRSKFRVYGGFKYETYAPKAVIVLAQSVCSLPGGYRFFQLDDPKMDCQWRTIEDPEISIREYSRRIPERWTAPAEDLTDENFIPRLMWPECDEHVFEVILTCGLEGI